MKLYISRNLKIHIAKIYAIKDTFTKKGYQVSYYKEGPYSRTPLAQSNVCIVSTYGDSTYVGKGQFSEIEWSLKFGKPCYHLVNGMLARITYIAELRNNWKTEYGVFSTNEVIDIQDFCKKYNMTEQQLLLLN